MKIFISADIEGCAGWAFTEEGHIGEHGYERMAQQMTREVVTACEAAYAAGATEVIVKDGHGNGGNIDPLQMPPYVTLIRGKSGHPYNMMYGLDVSFDAVAYIGYHAPAGNTHFNGSHTSTGNSLYIKLNGQSFSEFMLNTYTAATFGVPVIFISGDKAICELAQELVPSIVANPTKFGVGAATHCYAVDTVISGIHTGIKAGMENVKNNKKGNTLVLPKSFTYEVTFKDWHRAYKMAFYPGMKQVDDFTLQLQTTSWLEVATAHSFVVY